MLMKLLNAGKASEVGVALADAFVRDATHVPARAASASRSKSRGENLPRILQQFLQRVDREARPLKLNLIRRATLANSFKWRLKEQGVEPEIVEELTQALVLRLTTTQARTPPPHEAPASRTKPHTPQSHFSEGNACMNRGDYTAAAACYEQLLALDAQHVAGRNNLGSALCQLGHYGKAAEHFRHVLKISPHQAEAHCNLGMVLRWQGDITESERHLREALRRKPMYTDAQLQLSATLLLANGWPEARALLESVRKREPRNAAALVGLAQIAGPEGRFAEAEMLFKRAIEVDPHSAAAWAGLARLRRMTPADAVWLEHAQEILSRPLSPLDEADLRFAVGKYYDDLGEFAQAFGHFQRANLLRKSAAASYNREAQSRFVDELKRLYTRPLLSAPAPGASDSERPIFIVGMPRSGTSLLEQILASHPQVQGAGELGFWSEALRRQASAAGLEAPGEPARRSLAAGYLRLLDARCPGASRVVDKTPINSECLGLIHLVFPRARIIYLRRNPIDTCLSCYFQPFSGEMSFTMDLSDLAHYYREHARLMAHWREVLPKDTLLDVPYEELVGEQEGWTRRILEFLGLAWDPRCLDFNKTDRPVMTASFWQVRQEIYRRSGGRWRNYKRFIRPLLSLRDGTS